ncbi:MAG TPA: archaellin/type IV pilin N-terminal domain-containing protein [Candidatus Omnitrophota bacterium]|nr:archaellin/type IV pilin N-terminal domain-containing protein [Candidatus Omnitrophota bacterium]
MKKKGVSPIIATVLLIGLVIALGTIVFIWFRSFTQEAVTKFSGENVELVCGDVQFEASYTNGNLAISNTGNVPIYNFSVKIDSGNGQYTTQNLNDLTGSWPKVGLRAGGVFSGNVQTSGAVQLILIPILRGSISSGDEKSYTCGDRYGQTISV